MNIICSLKSLLVLQFFLISIPGFTQAQDPNIKLIFDEALRRGKSYEMLGQLTHIGPRLAGSPGAAAAVEWSRHVMQDLAFDSVWLQPVLVPHWVRGQNEIGRITNSRKMGTIEVNVCALGGSVGTGLEGLVGKVVEVRSWDELAQLGTKAIQGKIVFFNRAMDPTHFDTFRAYGGAVDQRGRGASAAAKLGAIAVIVRSMGSNLEDYPHTGAMSYEAGVNKIPAIAISTRHAEQLSKLMKDDKELLFYMETHCQTLDDAPSYNVVGQMNGSEYGEQYIIAGGHLDSWDLGDGAHDDGAGCIHAIEALRLLKAIGYQPRHSIRAVMFMNEENGLRGGKQYGEIAKQLNEKHIAAIESDRGGFTPRGFTISGEATARARIRSWANLFEAYGLTDFGQEGGGADIGPLAGKGVTLIGLLPDSQRYFDYHHTREDTFDKVNKRELELGAGAMAAMIYLIDRYGLE